MAKQNDFQKLFHFLVTKPYVYFKTKLEGSHVEAAATAEIEALETPVVTALENEFKTEVTTLLKDNPALTESAVVAALAPKIDTLISNAVNFVKSTNPIVTEVQAAVIAYAQSQVPSLIETAYTEAVAAITKAASSSTTAA